MLESNHIEVKNLSMSYGALRVIDDLSFDVKRGEVFVVMGGSGCGKSTLLKHLIGLKKPEGGEIFYNGSSFTGAGEEGRQRMLRSFGVLFQGGALWSSLSLVENVALPIREYTQLSKGEAEELAGFKLSLVGLSGFEHFYPSEISGGMRKRAGLARAMALDPEILFFDEPSAGLDPISSKRLDNLILELRETLGTTIVVVTHELASIFDIADNAIFLDAQTKSMKAWGNPHDLLRDSRDPALLQFLKRQSSPEGVE